MTVSYMFSLCLHYEVKPHPRYYISNVTHCHGYFIKLNTFMDFDLLSQSSSHLRDARINL